VSGSPDAQDLTRFDGRFNAAVSELEGLWQRRGDDARHRFVEVRSRYAGRRPAMVVDAVMSIQQRYDVVLKLVERFEQTPAAVSLRALERLDGIDPAFFNNSARRLTTITLVAGALARFGEERGLDDNAAVDAWSRAAAGLEFAPKADPYVGVVPGVGPAVLAYLRLLGGADTLKPDGRVHSALLNLGFDLPPEDASNRDGLGQRILMVGLMAAERIGASPGELDQLLWWAVEDADALNEAS
jgi:hypothetical protein